jgi:hypothetical protein
MAKDRRKSSRKRRHPTRRPDRSTWPVVRAYTPVPDAFRVSGFGTAGIVRQQPDGRLSAAFFFLNLSAGGIEIMWGKDDCTAETINELLVDDGNLPPYQEGSAELAGRYVYGAFAWGQEECDWSDEAHRIYLAMLPRPSGKRNWLIQQMCLLEPPLVSVELLRAIEDLVVIHGDAPRGKEQAVATFMRFAVADGQRVLGRIGTRPDDFQQDDPNNDRVFKWIKPRKRFPDQRVAHGVIAVTGNEVIAHAATLSHAAQMVLIVRDLSDGTSRLIGVDWRAPDQLQMMPPGAAFFPER